MFKAFTLLVLATLAAPISLPTYAAEITVVARDPIPVISVTGEFDLSDGAAFAARATNLDRAVVVFDSIGGNLLAGIRIGNVIQLKGFATAVPDGEMCASACALAWLGGAVRYMGIRARVGFHAAFSRDTGEQTGVGNALVGSYLNRLGLSDEVVVYATMAPPDQIQWLTVADAKKLGISVAALTDLTSLGRSVIQSRPQSMQMPGQDLRITATIFVNEYFVHWSDTNAAAMSYFSRLYNDSVEFSGRRISRDSLLAEKQKIVEHWPERLYSPRPKTIQAECDALSRTCSMTGLIDWDCRNPQRNERVSGLAKFVLQIKVFETGQIRVDGEWGSVISQSSGSKP